MAKESQKSKELEIITIDKALETVELKDVVLGDNGELVKLVDVEHTRGLILSLSKKYSKLVVTKDNYKKEVAAAEKLLRQTRYSLQNISKSNVSILNLAKKEDKELFETLIGVISPIESKLKQGIEEFKHIEKTEKEEKEKRERERIENIDKELKDLDLSFEKLIIVAKTEDHILDYDIALEKLENTFATFEEREFEAKKIHAIFSSRRKEIVQRVKEESELAEERKQREKNKDVILNMRIKSLESISYINNPLAKIVEGIRNLTHKEILDFNEIDWYKTLEEINKLISNSEERANKLRIETETKLKVIWSDLLDVFKGFGGDTSAFSEVKIPDENNIKSIKDKTIELQAQKNLSKKKAVNNEISPFRNEILEFISEYNDKITKATFENDESKSILNNLMEEIETSVNKVLGNSIND